MRCKKQPSGKQPSGKPQVLDEVYVESGALVKAGSNLLVNSGDDDQPYVAHVTKVYADRKDNARLKVNWYYFPDDISCGRQPYHAKNEIFKSNHEDELSSKSVIWTCTVLSLEKWVGFLATEANPDGPNTNGGPIIAENFDIEEDLSASKTISGQKRAREGNDANGNAKASKAVGDEEEALEDEVDEDADDKANAVYISRYEYDAVKEQWKDMEVPVFCSCNLPYNPDLDMAQCLHCNEWYHPECLDLPDAEVKGISTGKPWTCPACLSSGTLAR